MVVGHMIPVPGLLPLGPSTLAFPTSLSFQVSSGLPLAFGSSNVSYGSYSFTYHRWAGDSP